MKEFVLSRDSKLSDDSSATKKTIRRDKLQRLCLQMTIERDFYCLRNCLVRTLRMKESENIIPVGTEGMCLILIAIDFLIDCCASSSLLRSS